MQCMCDFMGDRSYIHAKRAVLNCVIIAFLAQGCGQESKERETKEIVNPTVSNTLVLEEATFELEELTRRAEELLDGIFANEWSVVEEPESKAALAQSTKELRDQLKIIDLQFKGKREKVIAMRSMDPDMQAEAKHHAVIWRQKVTELTRRIKEAEPQLQLLIEASDKLIAEYKKTGVSPETIDDAIKEVQERVMNAKRDMDTLRLELEKAKRTLQLYE